MKTAAAAALCAALGCSLALAQVVSAPFEVASVKPVPPMSNEPLDLRVQGAQVTITNLTLDVILREAFAVKRYQIAGGPSWLGRDRFDIAAKASREYPREQMMAMLRALLADRFRLKVHRETREGNIYALVVARKGPRLKPSTAGQTRVSLYRNTPSDQPGVSYTIGAQKATMALFAERLGEMQLDRPVLDRTGIAGEYDFQVTYATNDDPATGPSLFAALQEQLGLNCKPPKAPLKCW